MWVLFSTSFPCGLLLAALLSAAPPALSSRSGSRSPLAPVLKLLRDLDREIQHEQEQSSLVGATCSLVGATCSLVCAGVVRRATT